MNVSFSATATLTLVRLIIAFFVVKKKEIFVVKKKEIKVID